MKLSQDNFKKILLPYFPDDNRLQKFWWHKLIRIITIIVSATSIYTILWMITLFFFLPKSWMDSPLYSPIYHASYLLAYIPLNITSILSRFPIYGVLFRSLLPVPIIGPVAFIFVLIGVIYFFPSLLYRLSLYLYHNFHSKKVKIIFFSILLVLGLFVFRVWKYQNLISAGSIIADQHCLKVNPLVIARKNNYIDSMKVLLASGSAEEYWAENDKYLDNSKKYIEAEKTWLIVQKTYMDSQDFKTYIPSYIQEAAKYQYESREAEMKSTSTIVELLENYKDIDAEKQKALSDNIMEETNKSNKAYDKYNKIYDENQGHMGFKDYFTIVPQSTCPEENFNIPDVNEFLNPQAPINANGFNS